MRKLVLLFAAVACSAADWTCAGSVQKREKILNVQNVDKLQLVAKLKLGDEPLGAPVIVGRQVTHKGIKDLVFVAGGGDVFAVDPDLGTLYWKRRLESKAAVTPVLGPADDSSDDDDDDISMGIRPLYLLQADGKISTLNAGSGADLTLPSPIPAAVRDCSRHPQGVEALVANGVRFELPNRTSKPVLRALDAKNGRELYRSGNEIEAPVDTSGLAIANGHVCFGDAKGTLYCFGFPVDL